LDEVVDQLDKILMDDLVKRKSLALREIVQDGLVNDGTEWAEGEKPTGKLIGPVPPVSLAESCGVRIDVRPYMFKALLYLVRVHSDVNELTPNMVKRVIERMMEELAQAIKDAFQHINKLSMGGMLTVSSIAGALILLQVSHHGRSCHCQATLEIEFLHQTLGQYVTSTAKETLNDIYSSISETFTSRGDSGDLQRELEELKKILFEARRATSGHYLCFKPPKAAKARREDSKVTVGPR
jgi:exocyst complex component 2